MPVTTTWSSHSFASVRVSPGRMPIVVPPALFAPRAAAAITSPSPPVTTVAPRPASSRPTGLGTLLVLLTAADHGDLHHAAERRRARRARSSAAASRAGTSRGSCATVTRRSSARRTSCSTRRSYPRRRRERSSRGTPSCRSARCAPTPSSCSASAQSLDLEAQHRRPSTDRDAAVARSRLALGAVPRTLPIPGLAEHGARVQVARRRDLSAQPRPPAARGGRRSARRRRSGRGC